MLGLRKFKHAIKRTGGQRPSAPDALPGAAATALATGNRDDENTIDSASDSDEVSLHLEEGLEKLDLASMYSRCGTHGGI
jgi:hypothetical protein